MPPLTPDEQALALKYLEGEVTDDERSRVEERMFHDDEYFDQLEALQDELVNDYVLDLLPRERRRRFQMRIDTSPSVRRDVEFTSSLRDVLARESAAHPRRVPHSSGAAFAARTAATLWPGLAAAAAIVLMATSLLLVRQVNSVSRQLADVRAQGEQLSAREQALAAQLEDARGGVADLRRQVQEERARADRLERDIAAPPGQGAPQVEFVLSRTATDRGALSSARPRVFAVPAGATVRLHVELPPATDGARARVELQTADGEVRWSQNLPIARPQQTEPQMDVRLPAGTLAVGTYFLVVGPPDLPLATYELSVVRP